MLVVALVLAAIVSNSAMDPLIDPFGPLPAQEPETAPGLASPVNRCVRYFSEKVRTNDEQKKNKGEDCVAWLFP